MSFDVDRLSPALGAEVRGLDISRPLSAAQVAEVRRAWLEHLVLVFRGRSLNDDQLCAFSRQFGTLDAVPAWHQYHVPGQPNVLIVSNVKEQGKPIGVLGDGEAAWHTDMSYIPLPPTASLLHALEIPDSGGDTYWMNMYAVYEALPEALKRRIKVTFPESLHHIHGFLVHGHVATHHGINTIGNVPEQAFEILRLQRFIDIAFVMGRTDVIKGINQSFEGLLQADYLM